MSKIKIKLNDWSEAESDLNEARCIASMLSTSLFNDGLKQESEIAYAIERRIEAALKHIESGSDS